MPDERLRTDERLRIPLRTQLLLFSGGQRRDGWTTLDGDPDVDADIIAIVPPFPPQVTERVWDAIEWSHGIGSLYPWEAAEALSELRAVLGSDGVLALEQPDAAVAARAMLADHNLAWWMFGDPALRQPLRMNRWAYTPAALAAALRVAGFTRVARVEPLRHPARDFRIEARP